MPAPQPWDDLDPLETFDLYDPAVADGLYDTLAGARERCPVSHSSANGGFFLVSRYEDVKTILTDDDTFRSSPGKALPLRQTQPMPPLDTDPPMHREFRVLLNRFFSRRGLEPYEAAIRDIARATVDTWIEAGTCEFVEDYGNPFTATVLAKIILAVDDLEEIRRVQHLVESVGTANAATAWQELAAFVTTLLQERERAAEQPDDVLGAILHGTVDGRSLTESERIGTTVVLLLGGLDTTQSAMSNIMCRLAQDRDLQERLGASGLTAAALEEFLRIDSPVTALARHVATDTVLGGVELHPGDHVLVHYASANRDEAVFDEPDQLDLERDKNPHAAFGLGIHRCIGLHLARMSIAASFEEILDRVEDIRVAPGAEIHFTPGIVRHPKALPITFKNRNKKRKKKGIC
jgi:cytochrome P450